MQDFEKLGVFYLGKEYDLEKKQIQEDLILYDAKDLTTHAVCVGMTGSGKTGLCLSLLEEAAIDGIPAILIDPKGDISNLLLAFPELRPEDFRPWVDPAEATRRGQTPDEFAAKTAETWRNGLAAWGQDPSRIKRYRDAVDLAIYTPGSQAGLPLTVLRSFTAPTQQILDDSEAMRERVSAAASGLLALLGTSGDPLRSREHILISNILDTQWRDGKDVPLGDLIRLIQKPPFKKIGVMDLESFYPAKERFEFAMSLNNLMASPGFQAWTEGEPLDIQRLLYTPEGKPRMSILSIAHLTDSERMFFVTILLNEIISWVRAQSGTSSLRALLYMDEVFGYFPPTANPPSKVPMLTLLKQARAFGLGVVLATQNPVDLDYKGLSNAGTWFLGRLQTERDKARVLDGLEGASTAAGSQFDRQRMEKILSGLGNRVFLLNNVHEDQPVVFQTRWALSYLRGPVTREQIRVLMKDRKKESAANVASISLGTSSEGEHPVLPPGIDETFLVRSGGRLGKSELRYRPGILGTGRIHFANATAGVDYWQDLALLVPGIDQLDDGIWDTAELMTASGPETEAHPEEEGRFETLPSELMRPKTFTELSTAMKDFLYRTQRLKLFKCAALKETSQPGELEGDFRVRITQGLKEQRDLQIEKLRTKYAPKLNTLNEQLRKAYQKVEKEKTQQSNEQMSAAVTIGASVLGAIFGRKLTSATNVGRAATSIRTAGKMMGSKQDVTHAEETVEAIQLRLDALNAEFEAEVKKIQDSADPQALVLDEITLQPKKSDINVTNVVLAWTPWTVDAKGNANPAYTTT